MSVEYEYKIVPLAMIDVSTADSLAKRSPEYVPSIDYIESMLNELGQQGWNMCGVISEGMHVFKRKITRVPDTGPR